MALTGIPTEDHEHDSKSDNVGNGHKPALPEPSPKQVNLRFFATAISLGSLALIAAIWLLELR